jgi:superfamily II DNA helicase RecQ
MLLDGGSILLQYSNIASIVYQVLFVSPERFLNEEFLMIFRDTLPISLVVIDEAHCISEW